VVSLLRLPIKTTYTFTASPQYINYVEKYGTGEEMLSVEEAGQLNVIETTSQRNSTQHHLWSAHHSCRR